MKERLLALARSRAAWALIVALLVAAGVQLTPEQREALIAAGVAAADLLAALLQG